MGMLHTQSPSCMSCINLNNYEYHRDGDFQRLGLYQILSFKLSKLFQYMQQQNNSLERGLLSLISHLFPGGKEFTLVTKPNQTVAC